VTACVAPAAGWHDGCPLDGERSVACRGALATRFSRLTPRLNRDITGRLESTKTIR